MACHVQRTSQKKIQTEAYTYAKREIRTMTPVTGLCEKVHTVACTKIVYGHPERNIRITQVHAKDRLSTSFDSSKIALKASIQ